jgi:hypothetical protein
MYRQENHSRSPAGIAQRGEKIYQDRYKQAYEREQMGRFVAVDVETEEAYLGDSSAEALSNAREAAPHGAFHLMRVGQPTAFRSSRHTSAAFALEVC